MPPFVNISGQRFGMLVVGGRAANDRSGRTQWHALCDCGNRTVVRSNDLRRGKATSCRCDFEHGHAHPPTPTYRSWKAMRERCSLSNNINYANYGGRGIRVCDRWQSFQKFIADMGERPDGMTLDRFPDRDGNYEPENCRWATPSQQAQNRRSRACRISEDQASEILGRLEHGELRGSVASRFGVSRQFVYRITSRRMFPHLAPLGGAP